MAASLATRNGSTFTVAPGIQTFMAVIEGQGRPAEEAFAALAEIAPDVFGEEALPNP